MKEDRFEPKIIAMMCNWCAYGAADLAGDVGPRDGATGEGAGGHENVADHAGRLGTAGGRLWQRQHQRRRPGGQRQQGEREREEMAKPHAWICPEPSTR